MWTAKRKAPQKETHIMPTKVKTGVKPPLRRQKRRNGRSGGGRKKPTPRPEIPRPRLLDKAERLLKCIPTYALPDLVEVLERHAGDAGMAVSDVIDFETFANGMGLVDDLIGMRDMDSVGPTDMSMYIHNEGNARESAEALWALLPIVQQVYDRTHPSHDEEPE